MDIQAYEGFLQLIGTMTIDCLVRQKVFCKMMNQVYSVNHGI